jgi:hypothetical protein
MDDLVRDLYSAFPVFKKHNDPFFDNYDTTVFGSFGLFLKDMANFFKHNSIPDRSFHYLNIEEHLTKPEMLVLLEQGFHYMENLYLKGDTYTKDVVNSSFFEIIVTSSELWELVQEMGSKQLLKILGDLWQR